MIILSRGSLTKTGRFAPETMALNLCERGSTATITFKVGTASLTVGDWLQDDTEPGAGIVWRVKTIDTQYNTETVTVQLEDMICSLNDQLLNGEVKPSDMGGSTNCTALQAITYVLNRQSVWTLNNFDYSSVSNPYNFNGDSLKSAIEIVSGSLTDPVWSYDFSSYPFKLNITQLSGTVDSEMRMSRNITTLRKTEDRSRMYTRFYPIGKNNLRPDSPQYYEKNVSTYGLIEKTETDESKKTKSELASWAAERLNTHAEPMVTVSISGLDLSEATGEALDSFTIGKKCRVPLPEYNTTITEKVTKLSWRDKLADPESVTVTLANQQEDVASIINRISKSSGRAGRTKAKDEEEDHAWIVDTTEKVALVAEAVAGKDGSGNPNWSRVAQLTVDGNGVDARVTLAEGNIVTAQSRITQTENNISLVVEGEGSNAHIKPASIVAAINAQTGQSKVSINADQIVIGELSDEDLNSWASDAKNGTGTFAKFLTVRSLSAEEITTILANIGSAEINILDVGDLYCDQLVTGDMAPDSIAQNPIGDFIAKAEVSQDGTTLTLTPVSGEPINFRKAGSATSLSGSWSGRTYTVTASPQGNTISEPTTVHVLVPQGALTATASAKVATPVSGGSGYTDHGDPIYMYLVPNGRTVTLKSQNSTSEGLSFASATVSDANLIASNIKNNVTIFGVTGSYSGGTTLSGSWNSNTYTVTASPQGDTISVSPVVHVIVPGSSPTATATAKVATSTSGGSGYTDHGNAVSMYLVKSGLTVSLKSANSTSEGLTYATTTLSDANLVAGNIKSGVSIFGVSGSYSTDSAKNEVKIKPFTANSVSSLVNYRTFTYTTDAPNPASGTSRVETWFVVHAGLDATTSGNDKIQPGTLKAELRYGTSTGTTYARRNFTINHVELWTKNDPVKVTDLTISSETEFYPWCMVEGEWLRGNKVTITPAGASHSPTIDYVWTSQSIPSGATELNRLKTQYELAKSDGDNFCVRVSCGGKTKTYYCTP